MVHEFGTNSWREIPKVPSYVASGAAIYAHGYLHWLVSFDVNKPTNVGREVVWFDVTEEEFGLINTPKTLGVRSNDDHLVDIAGEVGLVCNNPNRRIDIWILKQKEWVSHCSFDLNYHLRDTRIKVLGCWNKEGDILVSTATNIKRWFYVYRLKSGDLNSLRGFGETITLYYDNIICHQRKLPFNMIKIEGKMSL
ncbi:uncharacterized protein [Rutidosis leptorrhynchoides]|uniref:uncharacterized protein n=1 Tax=Rutidosis leptorrhynchoides TaxID=125765 RepID=UPI003A998285